MKTPKPRNKPGPAAASPCIQTCDENPVCIEENGVRASFANPRSRPVRRITYDNCYNKNPNELKADYILGVPEGLDVIVELKGSDLKHAYLQVETTLDRWKGDPIRYAKIVCLIVYGRLEGARRKGGRIPRMNSSNGARERDFLYRNETLLLIRESSARLFKFDKTLGTTDGH
jgi:hypothetical protein